MGGIATYYQSLLSSSLPQKVDLYFVETSSQKRTLSQTGKFSFSNLILAASDCLRFTKAAIKHRPQLTHIATAFGLSFAKHGVCVIVARLLGSRVLLHPHCGFAPLYTERPALWKWFFRMIMRMTNGVITLSSEWNQLAAVVPGRPIYFSPNAIDLSEYQAIGLKNTKKNGHQGTLRALYLGYLARSKGSFDLIEAAKMTTSRHVPVTFDLVGEEMVPGDEERLKKQIEECGLSEVVTMGAVATGPRKIDVLGNADIFVYPSYTEGMPIAVIEAMACGLPIVATRVGGLPDLVNDGINGLLVEAGRVDQLANAIESLCTNPGLRSSMQRNSFEIAFEEYEIEKAVPRLVDIYMKTLA